MWLPSALHCTAISPPFANAWRRHTSRACAALLVALFILFVFFFCFFLAVVFVSRGLPVRALHIDRYCCVVFLYYRVHVYAHVVSTSSSPFRRLHRRLALRVSLFSSHRSIRASVSHRSTYPQSLVTSAPRLVSVLYHCCLVRCRCDRQAAGRWYDRCDGTTADRGYRAFANFVVRSFLFVHLLGV